VLKEINTRATSSCSSTSCIPSSVPVQPRADRRPRRSSSPSWHAASCRPSVPPRSTRPQVHREGTPPLSAGSSRCRSASRRSSTPFEILKGLRDATRRHHRLITDFRDVAAARFRPVQSTDRFLPDKAIRPDRRGRSPDARSARMTAPQTCVTSTRDRRGAPREGVRDSTRRTSRRRQACDMRDSCRPAREREKQWPL